jgi:2-isopropylmalate synthase
MDVIEAGFPIASEGDFEAVQTGRSKYFGPKICGLARTHEPKLIAAGKPSNFPPNRASIPSSPLPPFTWKENCARPKPKYIELAYKAVRHARKYCDDVEFSPKSRRTNLDYMSAVVRPPGSRRHYDQHSDTWVSRAGGIRRTDSLPNRESSGNKASHYQRTLP